MIIKTDELQEICSKILKAVDTNPISEITETLELICTGESLYMNVTNRDYYVSAKINVAENTEKLKASVKASTFLKLISQVTTPTVELDTDERFLTVKANGTYTIPMIFDDDKLLQLPVIKIENVTNEFKMPTSCFRDMIKYNSKELQKTSIRQEVQRLYYVDEKGCITFSSGACVTDFNLPEKIKILFSDKIVKLTSLFKSDELDFVIGQDVIGNTNSTKIRMTADNIQLTAILISNDRLISNVPVDGIRKRASEDYNYNITVNTKELSSSINRLLVFKNKFDIRAFINVTFKADCMELADMNNENKETIKYCNDCKMETEYTGILDALDIKSIMDSCSEEYINIKFGNQRAVVFARKNISNVIPEARNV